MTPDAAALEEYESVPELVTLDITSSTVYVVASKLAGLAGLGGTYAVVLKHWLLRFGKESNALQEALADFAQWTAN